MPRKSWATPTQTAWLTENVHRYREAQRAKNVHDFMQGITATFLEKFPLIFTDSAEGQRIDELRKEREVDYTLAPDLATARKVRP